MVEVQVARCGVCRCRVRTWTRAIDGIRVNIADGIGASVRRSCDGRGVSGVESTLGLQSVIVYLAGV